MATQSPETPSPPLAEAEIARLVKAAGSVAYQPGNSIPPARQGPFRPRSLLDIVRTVEPEDPAEVTSAVADPDHDATGPSLPAEEATDLSEADRSGRDNDAPAPAISDPQPTAGAVLGAATVSPPPPATRPAAPTTPQPDAAEIAAEIAAAREAGRREGAAETRAALAAETAAAAAALDAAAAAFLAPPADAMRALQDQIAAAVLALASARAGSRIDELPAAFLARIETIALRVQAAMQGAVLRLNPDDLAVIAPLVGASEHLAGTRLVARPDFARGDVELVLGGLVLSDRLGVDATATGGGA